MRSEQRIASQAIAKKEMVGKALWDGLRSAALGFRQQELGDTSRRGTTAQCCERAMYIAMASSPRSVQMPHRRSAHCSMAALVDLGIPSPWYQ
jgi:hypothetical protein